MIFYKNYNSYRKFLKTYFIVCFLILFLVKKDIPSFILPNLSMKYVQESRIAKYNIFYSEKN
jgi:hypothetical protein